jgi:hypothetical protein
MRCFAEAMSGDVGVGCSCDAFLFAAVHSVFRRIVRLTALYFDEDEDVALPGNDVHLTVFCPEAGSDNSVAE